MKDKHNVQLFEELSVDVVCKQYSICNTLTYLNFRCTNNNSYLSLFVSLAHLSSLLMTFAFHHKLILSHVSTSVVTNDIPVTCFWLFLVCFREGRIK